MENLPDGFLLKLLLVGGGFVLVLGVPLVIFDIIGRSRDRHMSISEGFRNIDLLYDWNSGDVNWLSWLTALFFGAPWRIDLFFYIRKVWVF